MENSEPISSKEENSLKDEFQELLQNLPKERDDITGMTLYLYQGFWLTSFLLKSVLSFQKHFVSLDDDLLSASCPKSGTTWLKALSYTIINRHHFPLSNCPLLTYNPHILVPNLEFDIYDKPESVDTINNIPKPRLLCTHISYPSLPISIKNSNCKIVYIFRNTMDQFVSSWLFNCKILGEDKEPVSITEESFDQFCREVHLFGPFWDHVLESLKACLERPGKILFIKYEDLKNDALFQVLAKFLGFPFSEEEEKQGVVKHILKFCSIDHMKSLRGNIDGKSPLGTPNYSAFFRKGEIGDWVNHLTPLMAERMKMLIQEKFEESNLQML